MAHTSQSLLLLTSTIDCGNTPYVSRRATEQRLEDYKAAMSAWLQVLDLPDVVFCDNSGADLTPIRELLTASWEPARVRVLSFAGNDGAQQYGKGYGEMEIIRHVFDNTPAIGGYRHILKVSGRYAIANAANLLRKIGDEPAGVLCNLRKYLTYADSTVFSISPYLARTYLFPLQDEIDDHAGRFFEHILAKCVSRILADGGHWRPLPCSPILRGSSGTTNSRYSAGLARTCRQVLFHALKRGVLSH